MLVDAAAIVATAAGGAAAMSCAWAGHRLDRARGRWLVWLSLALFSWTVGHLAWTLHRWDPAMLGRGAYSDVGYLADAGQVAMPLLALAALAAVPAGRASSSSAGVGGRGGAALAGAGIRAGAGRVRVGRVRVELGRAGTGVAVAGAGLAGAKPGGTPARSTGWHPDQHQRWTGSPSHALVEFDELILAGSLFLLTWSGLLAGLGLGLGSADAGISTTRHLVAVAHPVTVVVLVLAVLHVAGFRRPADVPAVAAAGTGLVVLAFVGLCCTQANEGSRAGSAGPGGLGGTAVGPAAVVGALLVILAAARAGRRTARADRAPARSASHIAWLRPAAPCVAAVGVAALLLGRSWRGIALDPVEITVGVALAVAVLVRQLVVLRANQHLVVVLGDAEQETRHWISHDPLTELANRGLFHQRLVAALAASRRTGHDVAVIYCDLDDFRVLNDSLGHAAGDHLLRAVGQRLRHCVRTADTVARFGSDEFALLLDGGQEPPAQVAERVLTALRQPESLGGHHWPVRASVGLAVAGRMQESAEALVRQADTALLAAKQTGKNRLVVYQPGLNVSPGAQFVAGTHLADALATALRRGSESAGFAVHYQPIVRLGDRQPVALEALARWTAPGRGPVPPGTFVAAAESSGIVGTLDDMILGQACAEIAVAYPDAALRLHVNVSASRVADMTLLDSVARALATSRFDPRRLVVEVTETSRLSDLHGARAVLEEVRALGVAVALDDVGAGYSTLAALHLLPVDVVKLDRTLLESPQDGGRGAALRRSMIGVAHALGAVVVAEGIEQEGQVAELAELGCELGQGFLFARPAPLPAALLAGTCRAPRADTG